VKWIELLLLLLKEAKETVVLLRFIPGDSGSTAPPIQFPMKIVGNPLRVDIQSPKEGTNKENLHHLWPKNHIAEAMLLQECLQLSPLLAPFPCSLDSSLQLSERNANSVQEEETSNNEGHGSEGQIIHNLTVYPYICA